MKEFYRKVKGYESHYMVSNLGRVKNIHTGKILKPATDNKGYSVVSLHYINGCKTFRVHKIVADAFPETCGVWFPGAEIDHINTNKKNNCFLNLKYKTSQENRNNPLSKYHYAINAKHVVNGKHYPVIEINNNGIITNEWYSQTIAANHFGVHKTTIGEWIKTGRIINGCRLYNKKK